MSGARVLGGRRGLRVEGHGPILPGHDEDELVAALDVVGPASLASLRRGLRRATASRAGFVVLSIVDAAAAKVAANPDKFWREPVEFRLSYGWGEEEFYVFAAAYGDPDEGRPRIAPIERLIAPLLARHKATATVARDDDESDFGGAYQLGISITMRGRGHSVRDAYELGQSVLALIEAAGGGGLTLQTTVDLLRAGRVAVLLGQPEMDWIDFKRQGYKRTDPARFELAKDVASFANAEGGLLVLGVATVKRGDGDVASAIIPCATGSVSAQSYRAIIARRVHPPPERIEIFSIPQGSGGAVWIVWIPPQPQEFKPFLVHGAVVGGKVHDAYFSMVTRRGDSTTATHPQAVHALLSAGRAALHSPARRSSGGRTRG